MKPSFSHVDHEVRAKALLKWYQGLGDDKGSRARLRRAASPDDVIFEPAFHRLLAGLREVQPRLWLDDPRRRRNLAAFAGLAARVEKNREDVSLAKQMGTPGDRKSSSGAPVSEQRFRRLLTAPSLDDRFTRLSRVIPLLGKQINLLSLADALYDWDDDPDLRQQWAYDYYSIGKPPALPGDSQCLTFPGAWGTGGLHSSESAGAANERVEA
ncbi:MAG: type I-E CRISPR-associated protein Cse2/CasB, partial [Thermoanaerobaculia bacterium]